MVMEHPHTNDEAIFILLAAGFEEEAVVSCLTQLRSAGVSVSLIGASAGLVRGMHGVTIKPDSTLGKITAVSPPKIVFIPDGKQAVTTLLSDPRVHRLLSATVENNGRIAAMPTAAAMLDKSVAPFPLIRSNGNLNKFFAQLID